MKKILIIIAALTAFVPATFSQIKVYPLSDITSKDFKGDYFAYMLPTTTLKVTVTEIKVTEVKGYYSNYAENLLGLTNFIKENKTHYELGGVKIEPVTSADASKNFIVVGKNIASAMKLFEKESYIDKNACSEKLTYSSNSSRLPDFFRNYADLSYTQQSQAFVETKIIDGVVTQVPASHTKVVSKSFEQKARQAADAIVKCRNDQYLLAAGEQETPYSGEALQTMIKELKLWEDNYMSLFTGVTLYDTLFHVFYVTPADKQDEVAIFGFSAEKGLAENASKGDIYSLKFSSIFNSSSVAENLNQLTASTDQSNYFRVRKTAPVRTKLLLNSRNIYDFGIINMFQFSETQLIPFNSVQDGCELIGFIY